MHVHIQNLPTPNDFDVTEAEWDSCGIVASPLTFGRTAEDFAAAARTAEVIIAPASRVRSFLPLDAPRLKMLFVTSAGVDKMMPLDWLPEGVALVNNSGTHGQKAGEFAAMALIMLSTRMPTFVRNQREERWESIFTPSLRGRHALIVGTGDMGSATAREARHFGMRTTGVRTVAAPHPDFDTVISVADLDKALPDAEFLVLACPLTAATQNLMHRARLESLPKAASLLNLGRGGLLDQDALCDLLDTGHLAGALIDVTTPEPPPPGHRVWQTRNLVITPHCSVDDPLTYNRDSLAIMATNLRALQAGQPLPNRVDPTRGY